jgi:6-phosphogluconolactonase (cycloisomerase 2 family)
MGIIDMHAHHLRPGTLLLITLSLLAGCGGGGGSNAPPTYSIGGTVTGLAGGTVVLQNSGLNNVSVSANGSFTFSNLISSGSTYSVTVLTQPTAPSQTCTVANASGGVSANVTIVAVTCTTNTYSVGGTVAGLVGSGLVLRNNGGNSLAIAANSSFTFPTAVASGAAYAVTVLTQPSNPTQTCTVANGAGTVAAGSIANVAVTCGAITYSVGGTVSGLSGTGLVLQNNGGNSLSVTANGSFTFTTPAADGAAYAVSVLTQPSNPAQVCAVANGSGTVANANISNVAITCTTNTYTVGGTISGLSGSGLVLQLNGANNFAITAGATSFAFANTPLSTGSSYAVTVLTQPISPAQTCALANSAGSIAAANITNVAITCVTDGHTVGGTVSGLGTASSVVLQNNAGNDLTVAANGSFSFTTPVANGSTYAVTVLTDPLSPARSCTVAAGTGTVTTANITTVAVSCRNRNVYISNALGDDGVGRFTIGNDGALSAGAHYTTSPDNATGLAITPSASHLFLSVGGTARAIKVYAIDHAGAQILVDTLNDAAVPANPNPSQPTTVMAHPAEGLVYVFDSANATIRCYSFDKVASTLTAASVATVPGLFATAMEPAGKFLFAASYSDQNVTPFAIGQATGVLSAGTPTPAIGGQVSELSLAMDRAGKFLFVAHQRDSFINSYGINATTGNLTFVNTQSTAAPPFTLGVRAMVVEPTGRYLYAANADGNIWGYSIEQATGAISSLGTAFAGSGSTANDVNLAVDSLGKLLYKTSFADGAVSIYSIDGVSGAVAEIPGSPFALPNSGPTAIAIE